MNSELIPVSILKIMQSKSYTVIVLGNDKKKFAIYTDPSMGKNFQLRLTEDRKPRPLTHELMEQILQGLNVKILQIVIQAIEDTVFFARLYLEQKSGDEKNILEIDARPSDCLTLAIKNKVPILCRKEVFEQAIPIED